MYLRILTQSWARSDGTQPEIGYMQSCGGLRAELWKSDAWLPRRNWTNSMPSPQPFAPGDMHRQAEKLLGVF